MEVHWDNGGLVATVTGTAAVDEAHAQAALKVLSTPDALLTLALAATTFRRASQRLWRR